VDARAAEIAGVSVFDMDDLQAFARMTETSPAEGITRAERIVQDEVAEYEKLLRIAPFLGELHKKVEDIRRREVERTLRHLPQADPEINEQIEILSRSLVRKILHEPTMHLRTEANEESLKDYMEVLSTLFDVDPSGASLSLEVSQQWEP
jgi:glutamyl-tRNA reductase